MDVASRALQLLELLENGEQDEFYFETSQLSNEQMEQIFEATARHYGLRRAASLVGALQHYRVHSSWLTTVVKHCLVHFNPDLDAGEDNECEAMIQDIPDQPLPQLHNKEAQMRRDLSVQRDALEALRLIAEAGPSGLGSLLARRILSYAKLPWETYLPTTPEWEPVRRQLRSKEAAPFRTLMRQLSLRRGELTPARRSVSFTGERGYL